MRKSPGFTLIEVVLATALFALLMTSYYVVVQKVLELQQVAHEDRSFASIAPSILDVVEDDLQSLYSSPRKPEAFPFRGDDDSLGSEPADRLAFVTRRVSLKQEEIGAKDRWIRSPVNETGYRLARALRGSGDVRRLFRRESYYVDQSPLDGGEYYEVYDRVIAFDVVYAGFRVEEKERTSSDTIGEHALDKFESWDSDERKALPSAVIVTLTIEAPRSGGEEPDSGAGKPPRRATMVRIVPLPQADDVAPDAAAAAGSTPPAPPNPPQSGTVPAR